MKHSMVAAEGLLVWIAPENNGVCAEHFTTSVIELLHRAFLQTVPVRSQAAREKMWTTYHNICVSEEFVSPWKTFLQKAGLYPIPIFY